MSFRFEQKNGDKVYVYEVTSYWDKDKKQPRQKRKYLGRKDPLTGEIIKTSKKGGNKPKSVLDFGNTYFLHEVANNLGLIELLKENFPNYCNDILSLVQYKISESLPLYLASKWSSLSYVDSKTKDITSQRVSELLDYLGQNLNNRVSFFKGWIKRHKKIKSIYFDITSISTYSKLLDLAEWGYNRDKEKLPQVNLGIVYGEDIKLPLYYTIYQGSIPDIKTLANVIKYNKEYGIKKTIFIMDRGFYSKKTIERLKDQKVIIPLTFSTNLSKMLLKTHSNSLSILDNILKFKGRIYYYVNDKVEISGVALDVHIFRDKSRFNDEELAFHKLLLDIEEKLNLDIYSDKEDIIDTIEGLVKGYSKFFIIEKDKKKFILKRNIPKIAERIKRFGTFILLTNVMGLDNKKILTIQRNRDEIEKVFNTMKNNLQDDRLRVNSRERVEGYLFLTYLALIISSHIQLKLNSSNELKNYSKKGLMYELKKLKLIQFENGFNLLTEVSKKVRTIFKEFGIDIPGDKHSYKN